MTKDTTLVLWNMEHSLFQNFSLPIMSVSGNEMDNLR